MAMRHLKQGRQECYPTTLAMLAGLTREDVLREVKNASNLTWSEIWANREAFGPVIDQIAKDLVGDWFPSWHGEGVRHPIHPKVPICLPDGRGTITYTFGKRRSHIVAYEDGEVFDPGLEGPLSYADWLLNLPRISNFVINEETTE